MLHKLNHVSSAYLLCIEFMTKLDKHSNYQALLAIGLHLFTWIALLLKCFPIFSE